MLHDVRLNVVRLVGLRLLFFRDFEILRFLNLEVALRLGLLGLGECLCQHALLVGLRLGNCSFPRCHGTLDRSVALGFGGRDVGVAFNAGDVGLAHVGDVLVLVADLFNGEGNYLEAHLVHVIGAGGAHAIAHHLRLLDNFFDGELSDDAAQMAFHDQADQAFALLIAFGEELLGRGKNRLFVGLYLDLRHGFDGDGYALFGVQILLRSHVERHEFERKVFAVLDHRKNDGAVSLNHAGSTKAIDDQRFMGSRFAI